jgi:hypothetical protein
MHLECREQEYALEWLRYAGGRGADSLWRGGKEQS